MNEAFWRGRPVMVTGHTGFKGSWLCLWLQRLGARVSGYALQPPTEPSLFRLARVGDGLASVLGDVRDPGALSDAFARARPEIVFHLAAQSLVRPSYDDPAGTYGTNVMGTVHVLEAARRTPGVRAVVVVTSDKCYENREWVWPYREDEPMGGADPYSSSKGCAELVTASWRRSFLAAAGIAAASARAGNVIGGGDWGRDRLVPDVMQSLLAGREPVLRNPGAVRPWQHVLEPLAGYLLLAERLCAGGGSVAEAWNFGPAAEDAVPVGAVAGRLCALWGTPDRWTLEGAPQPHEAGVLKLDSSKARARLGWRPRLDLDVALEWVADWYRAYRDGGDLRAATEAQIGRYESLGQGTP